MEGVNLSQPRLGSLGYRYYCDRPVTIIQPSMPPNMAAMSGLLVAQPPPVAQLALLRPASQESEPVIPAPMMAAAMDSQFMICLLGVL